MSKSCIDCCGELPPRRPGPGRPKLRCLQCKEDLERTRRRDRYREKHPGWEERRAAVNETQSEFRKAEKQKAKEAKENLTTVTPSDLSGAQRALDGAKLMKDGSADKGTSSKHQTSLEQASVNDARNQGALEADTTAAVEREKAERLKKSVKVEPALRVRERSSLETEPTVDPNGRAEEFEVLIPIPERPGRARVYKPLVLVGDQRVATDKPAVLPGYEPIWKSLLYTDPLASWNDHGYGGWAVDSNAGGFVEDERGGIHYRSEAKGSAGFLAIEAASGDAIKAIAKVRGKQKPRPEDAETLVRYLTGLLEPWERKRFGDTVHRLEGGEIRDANGRPILRRTQPIGNPSNMADAIVDLALKEQAA